MLSPQELQKITGIAPVNPVSTGTPKTPDELFGQLGITPKQNDTNILADTPEAKAAREKTQIHVGDYLRGVGSEYKKAGEDIVSGIQEGAKQMQQGEFVRGAKTAALRTAGGVAGAAFAPITEAVKPIIEPAINKLASNETFQHLVNPMIELANKHPEAAKDIKNVIDLVTLGGGKAVEKPIAEAVKASGEKVAGIVSNTAETVIPKAKEVINAGENIVSKVTEKVNQRVAQGATDDIINAITPELSKTKASQLASKGGLEVKKGTLFDTVNPKLTARIENAANSIKDIYDTSKTYTENINNIRDAISTEAENLKAAIKNVDHPYTFKELRSKLNNVELPIGFKNDIQQSKNLRDITNTAMKFAQENGGNISALLDARKQFDALVEETFPNLYEGGKPTSAYYAITKTRQALNDFIESQLPPDVAFKDSLAKQSAMYDAVSGLSSKAGSEYGNVTNKVVRNLQNFSKKHPIASGVAKVVAPIATYEYAKQAGVPLP